MALDMSTHSGGAVDGWLVHIQDALCLQVHPWLQLCTSMQVSTCEEHPVGILWVARVAVKLNT